LKFRQKRLEKIRQAKKTLEAEAEAQAQAQRKREEKQAKDRAVDPPSPEGETSPPQEEVKPDEKAQKNFTDPDSRIMRDGATKSFEQSYNCQAMVDDQAQVIVAAQVTQQANDKQQVEPLVEQMTVNLGGRKPSELSADAGYFSEDNVRQCDLPGGRVDRRLCGYGPSKAWRCPAPTRGADTWQGSQGADGARANGCEAANSRRQKGLRQTETDYRASLWSNQGGSWAAPISPTGDGLRAGGMELDLYHPQPVEAVSERLETAAGVSKARTGLVKAQKAPQAPGITLSPDRYAPDPRFPAPKTRY
jgi:hypothetical protein